MSANVWRALFEAKGWLDDETRTATSDIYLELTGGHQETLNYIRACEQLYFVVEYVDGNRVYYPWEAIVRVREERKPGSRGYHSGLD